MATATSAAAAVKKTAISGIEYKLTRARTSSVSVSVRDGVVKVRAPRFMPFRLIDYFVKKNSTWISEIVLQSIQNKKNYDHGGEFLLFGSGYKIERLQNGSTISIVGRKALVGLLVGAKEVEAFYKRELSKKIPDLIDECKLSPNHRKIIIKTYNSKWGSCSPRSISFNTKLAMAPIDVIKYVVAHELAHIQQPNHSKNFWKVVEEEMPDYKKNRSWLRKNSQRLKI